MIESVLERYSFVTLTYPSSAQSDKLSPVFSQLAFCVALAVGALLRLFNLGAEQLHFDEALSVFIAQGSLSEVLLKNVVHNSSPPFMVLALQQMLQLGQSEVMVRLLPAVAGMATIALVYRITLYLSTANMAALAALFYAITPAHVSLSRQFRIYEIGCFFAAIAIVMCIEYCRQPTAWRAMGVGLAMLCGTQVQYGLALLFAAMVVVLTVFMWSARLPVRRGLTHGGMIVASLAAGVAVVYFTSLQGQFYAGRGSSYLKLLGAGLIPNVGRTAIRTLELGELGFPSGIFVFLLGLGLAVRFKKDKTDFTGLLLVCSLGMVAVLGLMKFYPYGPVRQCLFLTVLMYPLAVIGLERVVSWIPGRVSWWLVLWFFAVAARPGLVDSLREAVARAEPSNFAAALRQINGEFQEGDVLLVGPGAYPHFLYYGKAFRHPWVKSEKSEAWMSDERAWGNLAQNPPYVEQIETLKRSHQRVWLLFSFRLPGELELNEIAAQRGWKAPQFRTLMSSPKVHLSLYQ